MTSMMSLKSDSRLATLYDAVKWRMRGVVESDAVRPLKFGLRDLCQRKEVARRTAWAAALLSETPATVTLDSKTGYLENPFSGLDLEPAARLGNELFRDAVTAQANTKGFHINQMLPVSRQHELLPTALHPALVRLATQYLGVVPILVDLDYFCSLPMPSDKAYSSSQLYHCDDTSIRMIKFFVYCDDVGDQDGPFEVVDASQSQYVRDKVHYRFGGRSYRVADDAMDALVPRARQHVFKGPRRTSFIVDTAQCFHRGSRIRETNHHRMVATLQFGPPNITQLPLRLQNGAPYRHLITSDMSPLTRALLGEATG